MLYWVKNSEYFLLIPNLTTTPLEVSVWVITVCVITWVIEG